MAKRPNKKSFRQGLKAEIRDLLNTDEPERAIDDINGHSEHRLINKLFSHLYDTDRTIRHRAAEYIGILTARIAQKDREAARNIMRRLIWSLNDDYGGIGWGAPETMGEIMARCEWLAEEYLNILLSFLDMDGSISVNESLQCRLLWAIGRLARQNPALFRDRDIRDRLLNFLNSDNPELRGLTLIITGLLQLNSLKAYIEESLNDESEIQVYGEGKIINRKICELAKDALKLISR